MKKNIKGSLLLAVITVIGFTSCSVTYRTHHPRRPRPKRVIVVGKITEPVQVKQDAETYVMQPVNKASEGITK